MLPMSVEDTLREAEQMRKYFEDHFIVQPSYEECVKFEETIDRLISLVAKAFLPPAPIEQPKFTIPE